MLVILMMRAILSSFGNTETVRAIEVMILSSISLFSCQLLKAIIFSIKEKKIDIKMLFTTGGFPSSHTSTVTTMVVSIAIFQITDSGKIDYVFAVAFIVALIIIHDAFGVRYEASKHAAILNKMVENETLEEKKKLGFGKKGYLKELLGHKKTEVFAGAIYGFLISLLAFLLH